MRHLANALLSALVAPPCAVCARVLERPLDGGAVCADCWASVVPIANPPMRWSAAIAGGAAVGRYEGVLRDILHALKYDGRRSVAPPLSRMMAAHGHALLTGADFLVPVPLHRRRRRERGFNQADDLARGLGLPVVGVLRRSRSTRPQIELPAAERLPNVKGAFRLSRRLVGGNVDVRDRVIVLVDDVTTTGATLEACARVLRDAGAGEVRALTAARVEI